MLLSARPIIARSARRGEAQQFEPRAARPLGGRATGKRYGRARAGRTGARAATPDSRKIGVPLGASLTSRGALSTDFLVNCGTIRPGNRAFTGICGHRRGPRAAGRNRCRGAAVPDAPGAVSRESVGGPAAGKFRAPPPPAPGSCHRENSDHSLQVSRPLNHHTHALTISRKWIRRSCI